MSCVGTSVEIVLSRDDFDTVRRPAGDGSRLDALSVEACLACTLPTCWLDEDSEHELIDCLYAAKRAGREWSWMSDERRAANREAYRLVAEGHHTIYSLSLQLDRSPQAMTDEIMRMRLLLRWEDNLAP